MRNIFKNTASISPDGTIFFKRKQLLFADFCSENTVAGSRFSVQGFMFQVNSLRLCVNPEGLKSQCRMNQKV
jgi:hypothetical protein